MNKVDLIRAAMERVEMPRKDAVALVEGLFEDIQDAVISGDPVKIPGFGQFKVRDRAARLARNPATGATVKVPAKRVFKFLPAKALREAVMARKGGASAKKATATKAASASKKTTAAKPAAKKAATKKATTTRKAAPARKTAAKKAPARKTRR